MPWPLSELPRRSPLTPPLLWCLAFREYRPADPSSLSLSFSQPPAAVASLRTPQLPSLGCSPSQPSLLHRPSISQPINLRAFLDDLLLHHVLPISAIRALTAPYVFRRPREHQDGKLLRKVRQGRHQDQGPSPPIGASTRYDRTGPALSLISAVGVGDIANIPYDFRLRPRRRNTSSTSS